MIKRDNTASLVLIRRIEALVLLALAVSLAIAQRMPIAVDALILGLAILLTWQNVKAQRNRRAPREIQDLLEAGLSVYRKYDTANELTASWPRTRDIALAEYETEKWVARTRSLLREYYPEFHAIFEAHG